MAKFWTLDEPHWIPDGTWTVGPPGFGVLAEDIVAETAGGDDGPGHLYDDASDPANTGKELCGRITEWPATGTLYVYPNGSFTYVDGEGATFFKYILEVDGVDDDEATEYLGASPVNCTIGQANAEGFQAYLTDGVHCSVGEALAEGLGAGIGNGVHCNVGEAVAEGLTVALTDGIHCSVGEALAEGLTSSLGGVVLGVGEATAEGLTAEINPAAGSINCGVGDALAEGYTAALSDGVHCSVGNALAEGFQVHTGTGVYCGVGEALAEGLLANIGDTYPPIDCSLGEALAEGFTAAIVSTPPHRNDPLWLRAINQAKLLDSSLVGQLISRGGR